MRYNILFVLSLFLALGGQAQASSSPSFALRPELSSHIKAGHTALQRGDFETALHKAQLILNRLDPTPYERALALKLLGYTQVAQTNLSSAAHTFEESFRLNALPPHEQTKLAYNIGEIYLRDGKPRVAIGAFRRWLHRSPRRATATQLFSVAATYHALGRYKDAVKYGEQALDASASPTDAQLKLMISAYLNTSDREDAIQVLSTLTKRHPNNTTYRRQLARLRRAGRSFYVTWDY